MVACFLPEECGGEYKGYEKGRTTVMRQEEYVSLSIRLRENQVNEATTKITLNL